MNSSQRFVFHKRAMNHIIKLTLHIELLQLTNHKECSYLVRKNNQCCSSYSLEIHKYILKCMRFLIHRKLFTVFSQIIIFLDMFKMGRKKSVNWYNCLDE